MRLKFLKEIGTSKKNCGKVIYVSKKDKCKELMLKFFGPATAKKVDSMTEENCVAKCREIVKSFLGEEKAKEFDNI